ncbi:hypothetical protein D3C77_411250 [compost metagenome]
MQLRRRGRGQRTRRRVGGGAVLHVHIGCGRQCVDQADAPGERLPGFFEEGRAGGCDLSVIIHFQAQMVVTHATEQRQALGQFKAVFHKACQGGDLVLAHGLQPAIDPGDVTELAGIEVVRVLGVIRHPGKRTDGRQPLLVH